MDRNSSLLPQSLFSASTLKRESADQTVEDVLRSDETAINERATDNNSHSNAHTSHSNTPVPISPTQNEQNEQQKQKQSRSSRKGRNKADFDYFHNAIRNTVAFPTHSDATEGLESDDYSSSENSTSSGDEEDDNEVDNVDPFVKERLPASELINIIQRLQQKLENQHARQTKHQNKLKRLNRSVNNTNKLLLYHAKLLAKANDGATTKEREEVIGKIPPKTTKLLPIARMPASSTVERAYSVPQVAKRSKPFSEDGSDSYSSVSKQRRLMHPNDSESDREFLEQGAMRNNTDYGNRRTDFINAERAGATAGSNMSGSLTRKGSPNRRPSTSNTTTGKTHTDSRDNRRPLSNNVFRNEFRQQRRFTGSQPNIEEIPFGEKNYMDVFTTYKRNTDTVFTRKPRCIMTSIAPEQMDDSRRNLMVATDLNGELQFWNLGSRRMIKNIGKHHLYDSWIEDICWVTPTTLAFCASNPSRGEFSEPLKIIHMDKVTSSTVTGKIQSLDRMPHEKGVAVISSVLTGDYSTPGKEKCSFVTGGIDKSVYLWNLARESPDDEFNLDNVALLNFRHTNMVHALHFDKHKNYLYSGGADNRFFIYDLQSNSVNRELKLNVRITQIIPNPVNPNITMITTAARSEQFLIYDQRMSGYAGMCLKFGQLESENLSRYVKPDIHQNGYMVCCGSQSSAKLNFWDLRSNNVRLGGPSFSLDSGMKSAHILWSLFAPRSNTVVATSSLRELTWLDYSVRKDERIQLLLLGNYCKSNNKIADLICNTCTLIHAVLALRASAWYTY